MEKTVGEKIDRLNSLYNKSLNTPLNHEELEEQGLLRGSLLSYFRENITKLEK